MGRSIHYEYGGVVYEHRRFTFVKLIVICTLLFGFSAATPRLVQKYVTGEPAPIVLSETPAAPVKLQPASAVVADTEDTDAINDPGLQKIIEAWVQDNSNQRWGIAVERLEGESIVAKYQANQNFYPASLYKLLITQGLSDKLQYTDWAKKKVYDYRGSHTYTQCVDLMIIESDNACGEAVGNAIGWKNADARLRALGLENTKLNSVDNRYTTAADMNLFLAQMHEGASLSAGAKQRVMTDLKTQKFREGIPAGSPGCTVYDKIGDLDGFKHDVAIVECGTLVYALSVLSQGGSYAQIADLAKLVNDYLIQ